ncbi:MAG: hypothetical protein JWN18_14 [Parcubacteria group bacterium]|nr:hypothetical protein [Parcubacteria group bacterium]
MTQTFNKPIVTALAGLLIAGTILPVTAFAAGPALVNLGSAGDFVILAKSGISTTGGTSVTGDIGVSPIAASGITGFGLIMDSQNAFSTSAVVSGKVYASDYATPTPANMSTAISDMETAYTDAAGRSNPTATGLGAGNIGAMTLSPGLYKWSTDVIIPTDVTLSGGANDVWIFQIAGNLTVSSSVHIILSGGAQPSHVFWQVAGQTTLGTNSNFSGIILDQTAIVMNTGATLQGRALAQTAVTLDSNTISISANAAPTPTPVAAPVPIVAATPVANSSTPKPAAATTVSVTPTNPTPTAISQPTATPTTTTVTTTTVTPSFPNTGFGPQKTDARLDMLLAIAALLMTIVGIGGAYSKQAV